MPTFTADAGTFSLTGGTIGSGLLIAGALALSGGGLGFTRSYDVDLGQVSNLRLDRLQTTTSYFNKDGQPTAQMQGFWQRHCEAIERSLGALATAVIAIQTAYDAAAQASAAASEAQAVVATVTDAVASVQGVVDDIQSGEFNFDSVTIGGRKFVNNDGTLEPYGNLV